MATSLYYTTPRKALLDHIDEDDKKTYLELWQGSHVSLLPLNQQPQPFLQMLEQLRQQQELEAEQHHQWPQQQFLVQRLPTPQQSPRVKFTWKCRGNESPFHSVRSLPIKKVVNLWQFKAVQNVKRKCIKKILLMLNTERPDYQNVVARAGSCCRMTRFWTNMACTNGPIPSCLCALSIIWV